MKFCTISHLRALRPVNRRHRHLIVLQVEVDKMGEPNPGRTALRGAALPFGLSAQIFFETAVANGGKTRQCPLL